MNQKVGGNIFPLITFCLILLLEVVVKLLSLIGYEDVTVVDNGKKALEAIRQTAFEVVLMDIMVCAAITTMY